MKGDRYRVQSLKSHWWSTWENLDYFYELKGAEEYFKQLLEGTNRIIKESEWI